MADEQIQRYIREAFRHRDEELSHPSVEQLAEYRRGGLPEFDRAAVERHLAECVPCREQLGELDQFESDVNAPPPAGLDREWRRLQIRLRPRATGRARLIPPRPARWALLAAGLIAAAGASLTWNVLRNNPANLLARAYHEERTSEFRIARAEYGPLRQERGTGSAFALPEPLLKALSTLARDLKARPDDAGLTRLRGEAEMIAHDPRAAVESLERARDLRPNDAPILADLGVAYALRGDAMRQYGDYVAAVDALGQSLKLVPKNSEALFNKAVVLEKMLLFDQAETAWQSYLALEPGGPWAAEARRRLAAVQDKLRQREKKLGAIQHDPRAFLAAASGTDWDSEAYLRDVVITDWLPAIDRDPDARRAAEILAARLIADHGDHWLSDLLRTGSTPAYASALNHLAAARKGDEGADAAKALDEARAAAAAFTRGSPGARWAHVEEVIALHVLLRARECSAAAAALIATLTPGDRWLRTEAEIEAGVCDLLLAHLDPGSARIRKASSLAREAHYGELALRADGLYIETADRIAPPSEVFARAGTALATFWSGPYSAYRFYQVVDTMRRVALSNGLLQASYVFARSGVWSAQIVRAKAAATASLVAAASLAGDSVEASNLVRQAAAASSAATGSATSVYSADEQIVLANADLQAHRPGPALARLAPFRDMMQHPPTPLLGVRYYSALGEAYRQKALTAQAVEALDAGMGFGRQRLLTVSSERERAGILRELDPCYRSRTALSLSQQPDGAGALRIWSAYLALDLGAPSAALPPSTLTLADLPNGLVAWFSSVKGSRLQRIAATRVQLADAATRLLRHCSEPGEPAAVSSDARQLYRWLLEPFAADLRDARESGRLAIQLDRGFTSIPFSVLEAPDGLPFAERFAFTVAQGFRTPRAAGPVHPLVIANPALGADAASRFPPLPDAEAEAAIVRAGFSDTAILSGKDATLEALAGNLRGATLVHFAGHGYSTGSSSGLLLAPSASDGEPYTTLRPANLGAEDWSHCSLVVLSACSAAGGEIRGPHNPDSLVRAFAKAGVPQIVASFWTADSAATRALMTAFYAELARGQSAPSALQSAQRAVRGRAEWRHPYFWAGFQLYGTV